MKMDFKTAQKWSKILGIGTLGSLILRHFIPILAAVFIPCFVGLAVVVLLFCKCPHCGRQIRPFEVDQCPHCGGALD